MTMRLPPRMHTTLEDLVPGAEDMLSLTAGLLLYHDGKKTASPMAGKTFESRFVMERAVLPRPGRSPLSVALDDADGVQVIVAADYDSTASAARNGAFADLARMLWMIGEVPITRPVLVLGGHLYYDDASRLAELLSEATSGADVAIGLASTTGLEVSDELSRFPELPVTRKKLPYGYEAVDSLKLPREDDAAVMAECFREHVVAGLLPSSKTGIICGTMAGRGNDLCGRRARLLRAFTFGACDELESLPQVSADDYSGTFGDSVFLDDLLALNHVRFKSKFGDGAGFPTAEYGELAREMDAVTQVWLNELRAANMILSFPAITDPADVVANAARHLDVEPKVKAVLSGVSIDDVYAK